MKKSDLLVLTSVYEGFPNVLVESLTIGTPVISTNANAGASEILLNGKSNFSLLPEKLKKLEADIDENNDGVIQDAELEKAINIIRKYKEKNKNNI